jgi:hypothetical protein
VVIEWLVALDTTRPVPSTPPNQTWLAPVKFVTVRVTAVPPEAVPEAGATVLIDTDEGTLAAEATRSEMVESGMAVANAPPTPWLRPAGEAQKTVVDSTAVQAEPHRDPWRLQTLRGSWSHARSQARRAQAAVSG